MHSKRSSNMIVLVLACVWHSVLAGPLVSPEPQITGGTVVTKGQIPYQVSVRDRRTPSNYNHICGGVIIGYQDILTAAQCVSDVALPNLYVVAGSTKLPIGNAGSVGVEASKVEIHPFYKRHKYDYDVAIIRLAKPLPSNRADIRPAVLLRDLPKSGTSCTVSGWGDINGTTFTPTIQPDLRKAVVNYVPNSECKKKYAYVPNDGLCSGPPANSKSAGACTLDAGGPLYCGNGLLGIYSWSEGCGTAAHPGVYSSIPFHHYWITEYSDVPAATAAPVTKGTTKKGAATTKKGAATTKKGAATTRRGAATTKKGAATTKKAGATTKKGGATTKKGGATTKKGGATTKKGGATTKKGGATTKRGGATTKKGGATTKKGGATTKRGGATTKKGGATTKRGGATTKKGGATTKRGGATTKKGGVTTKKNPAKTTQRSRPNACSINSASALIMFTALSFLSLL